jgi:aminoglycoside/choline kinase family phosphotransferase
MSQSPDSSAADPRRALARQWLEEKTQALSALGWTLAPESLRPASSDASFRRYFRCDGQYRGQPQSLILMDAPPDKESIAPFIAIADLMAKAGLSVPRITLAEPSLGFLLCTDLGQTTYLSALESADRDLSASEPLYQSAWRSLVKLQGFQSTAALPAYDGAKLTQEMRLFDEWYLGRHRSTSLSPSEQETLFGIYQRIVDQCLSEPKVIVHRDYHSRNLMVLDQEGPGILDFQDAVIGPMSYDLVSLLRDAYIEWPEEVQIDWAVRYWQDARRAGLPIASDFSDFWRAFEWMGLQRHLKVLGIFARLSYRDGKDAYLNDIPLVMRYAINVARRYQGLGPLAKLLERVG